MCTAVVVALAGVALDAPSQLLTNADLEPPFLTVNLPNVSGVIASNWTALAVEGAQLACAETTSNVYSGASCQQIVATGLTGTNVAMFYQPFIYQAGDVYNGTVWLRASADMAVQFELRGSNVTHRTFQAAASHIVTVGTNWTQVVVNGGWQNGSNGEFVINFLTNGTVWIDDAGLTNVTSNYLHAASMNPTVPVPATLFGMHINEFTAPDNWPPLQQGIVRFWDIGIHWNQMETVCKPDSEHQ
jgi:hypothetical protein